MSLLDNLTAGNSIATEVLTQLGLNGWNLSTGTYNGCSFVTFAPIPFLQDNQIYQQGLNVVAAYNQITGSSLLNGQDPNGVGALYNTILGGIQWSDEYKPQIVVKELPFGNRCNTEDMGSGGYEFKMTLLFLGPDYNKAVYNFENSIKNPPVDPSEHLVLVHPTRGIINGITRVSAFKIDTNLANWNGCTVSITFRSEQSNIQNKPTFSTAQNIINGLQSVLQGALAVSSSISAANSLVSGLTNGSNGATPVNYTGLKAIENNNIQLANTLTNNAAYIYQNSNSGVVNTTFASMTINVNYLPPSIVGNSPYTTSQGNIILAYYVQQCTAAIAFIKSYGFGGFMNESINAINQSISQLDTVATLLQPPTSTLTYRVPYDMSIREVLARNNLSMTQAQSILLINPSIPSANYIPKDFVVNL